MRIHTDRTAGVILDAMVERYRRSMRVETGGIDLKRGERAVGRRAVDGLGAVNVRKVTHTAQQTAGDARCAARTRARSRWRRPGAMPIPSTRAPRLTISSSSLSV